MLSSIRLSSTITYSSVLDNRPLLIVIQAEINLLQVRLPEVRLLPVFVFVGFLVSHGLEVLSSHRVFILALLLLKSLLFGQEVVLPLGVLVEVQNVEVRVPLLFPVQQTALSRV